MTNPKVSIIVPVYNSEAFLRKCMDSVVNQTLKDIEIICVNDGSTDNSADILDEYAQKDNRIVIITKPNGGLSSARNSAIEIIKGEYVGFCDSDDTVDLDFYEKLYEAAKRTNSDIACASIYRTDINKPFFVVAKEKTYNKNSKKYIAADMPNCSYVWNKIYKTEKIKKYNCYFKDGIYYEDMPWAFRTFYLLGQMVTVPKVRYHYMINPSSIVKQVSDKHKRDYAESVEYIQDFTYKYNIKTNIKSWNGKFTNRYDIYFLGLKLLRVDEFKFTKAYYLFGKIYIAQVRKFANIDFIEEPKQF